MRESGRLDLVRGRRSSVPTESVLLQGQNGIGTADRERDMDGVGRHGPDHQEVRSLVYRQREYRAS